LLIAASDFNISLLYLPKITEGKGMITELRFSEEEVQATTLSFPARIHKLLLNRFGYKRWARNVD